MQEVIFLWLLALMWIVFAVFQDLKTREIANWLNFSLVIFALAFRFFYSLFYNDGFSFFYNGLIGLAVFFMIGNLLYYGKMFAGGDAKLMIALGAILPVSLDILSDLKNLLVFFLIFLIVGSFYTLATSSFFCLKNFDSFKKEFSKKLKEKKRLICVVIFIGLVLICLGFIHFLFLFLGISTFIMAYLYLYAKAVDEACMIKSTNTKKLTEGDWLYKDLIIGTKTIRANWDGLTKQNIRDIKKKFKTVRVRQGIPFTPVFLLSFIVFVVVNILKIDLWNSFW